MIYYERKIVNKSKIKSLFGKLNISSGSIVFFVIPQVSQQIRKLY